jgi:hypothetical protein
MKQLMAGLIVLMLISCASTPDSEEPPPGEENGLAGEDLEGFALDDTDSNTSDQNQDDSTQPDINDEDSIADLENQTLDELFGGSETYGSISNSEYRIYNNTRYTYRAAIPTAWIINESLSRGVGISTIKSGNAAISIHSFSPAQGNRDTYNNRVVSEIERTDARYRPIIDGRDIQLYNGSDATFMVYEFRKGGVRYLRRTLTIVSNDKAYIIYLEAPINRFYQHDEKFNTFVRTFQPQ